MNAHEALTDISLSADEVAAVVKHAEANERRAAETVKGALKALTDRGMDYGEAVRKLQRLNLTSDELERLAKTGKKQPKIQHANPDELNDEDEDDKPSADLAKLADAYRRAFPEAKLSKEQAIAFVGTQLPEGRELLQLSKQHSINKNYPGQYVFDKTKSSVSQPLPTGVSKMSDQDLSAAFRAGAFDKLGGRGHTPPGPSRHNDGSPEGTHGGENSRPQRAMLGDHLTETNSADSLIDFPVDADGATMARKTAARIKYFQDQGYSADASASKVLQEQKRARGW